MRIATLLGLLLLTGTVLAETPVLELTRDMKFEFSIQGARLNERSSEAVRGTQLELRGQPLLRVGNRASKVSSLLGEPTETLVTAGETLRVLVYDGKNYHLLFDIERDRIVGIGLAPMLDFQF